MNVNNRCKSREIMTLHRFRFITETIQANNLRLGHMYRHRNLARQGTYRVVHNLLIRTEIWAKWVPHPFCPNFGPLPLALC